MVVVAACMCFSEAGPQPLPPAAAGLTRRKSDGSSSQCGPGSRPRRMGREAAAAGQGCAQGRAQPVLILIQQRLLPLRPLLPVKQRARTNEVSCCCCWAAAHSGRGAAAAVQSDLAPMGAAGSSLRPARLSSACSEQLQLQQQQLPSRWLQALAGRRWAG